jgi:membrane-bound serine protease (ClpP class)
MAIHPKHSLIGTILLGGIALGLILFMLGRISAGADLTRWLIGVAVGLVIVGAAGIGLVRHLPESQRFEGMLHRGAASSDEGFVSARARTELIGRTGVAASELRPAGIAEIGGERVDVTTEGDWVKSGTPVVVVLAEGMRIVVRPAPQLGAGSSSQGAHHV